MLFVGFRLHQWHGNGTTVPVDGDEGEAGLDAAPARARGQHHRPRFQPGAVGKVHRCQAAGLGRAGWDLFNFEDGRGDHFARALARGDDTLEPADA